MDIPSLYQLYLQCNKICTDTRKIESGGMFFALKGPSFNANLFAKEALAKGANYAIVDDPNYAVNEKTILVDDTLTSLQALAQYHRRKLTIPIIALTGSNGKTTTKELIHAVLSKKYHTLATSGNLNNHIGVPITILSIGTNIEIAVIEMGANHVGEIAQLCAIAQPTHGLITNIGKAHIGSFGGFENIVQAKSELYQHLLQNHGVVFINSRNPLLLDLAKTIKDPVYYPAKGDFYECEWIAADPFVKINTEKQTKLCSQLVGYYNFENIAAALCIAKYFNVPHQEAEQAITEYIPTNMRSQFIRKGSNSIIMDAYNANPSSMEVAIENFSHLPAKTKLLILGDMLELEPDAEKEHRNLGSLLQKKQFDNVYLCGSLMRFAKEIYPQAFYFELKDDLLVALQKQKIKNTTILIKASRGMKLELLLDIL